MCNKVNKGYAIKNIAYYDQYAQDFYRRTMQADVSTSYQKFLSLLPSRGSILDAGCGVGRDLKYFLYKGYQVRAFDGSSKMVDIASRESGVEVDRSCFEDLCFDECFDGIWAELSLIHVPYERTRSVYEKIHQALKPRGIFYASYKYGEGCMQTPGRDFFLMNEEIITPYLSGLFDVVTFWQEKDIRSKVAPSPEGKLFYMIASKIM